MLKDFEDVDVIVNGQGLSADSASIATDNSLEAIYTLGNQSVNTFPAGSIKANLSISYFLNCESDPNLITIAQIKAGIPATSLVEIGGYYATSYLQSFSLKAAPHDLVKCNASYICFVPLSGELLPKRGGIDYKLAYDKIGHGWTTYVTSTGSYLSVPTYDFDYSTQLSWSPVYFLNRKYPNRVNFLGGSERISLVRDEFFQVTFSGQNASTTVFNSNAENYIGFTGLASQWGESANHIGLSFANAKVNSTIFDAKAGATNSVRIGIISNF